MTNISEKLLFQNGVCPTKLSLKMDQINAHQHVFTTSPLSSSRQL